MTDMGMGGMDHGAMGDADCTPDHAAMGHCTPATAEHGGGMEHSMRDMALAPAVKDTPTVQRSEEHTSELQSLMRISYAVFCLKKKNETINTKPTYNTQTTR